MKKVENSHLESYKIKLTTLSPVFIGGGDMYDLKKSQYIFDPKTKFVSVIDEKKFSKFLIEQNYDSDYANFLVTERFPSVYQWLSKKNIDSFYDVFFAVIYNDIFKFDKYCENSFL